MGRRRPKGGKPRETELNRRPIAGEKLVSDAGNDRPIGCTGTARAHGTVIAERLGPGGHVGQESGTAEGVRLVC